MIVWHNGTFKNEAESGFALADRVRYGDGVFDTILFSGGKTVMAHAHLVRLRSHADILDISIGYDDEDLLVALRDVAQTNGYKACALNIILTRGETMRGLMPPDDASPKILIKASPLPSSFEPAKAIIALNARRNDLSALSRIKSLNYGDSILALLEAKKSGANEAILLNTKGNVACASSSNLYAQIGGVLYTPPLSDGALDGIIRSKLLRHSLAQEKILTPDDLKNANAIYLSNSIRGVYPLQSLDGLDIPEGTMTLDADFHCKE